jgi:hypothetical protein
LNILKELTILSLIFSLVNFCSATMASKKDRGKGKIVNPFDNKSLASKPESSPIGTPAASPTTTSLAFTNRFMTFSPEPNITFSSALATEFSPFLGPSIRPRMSFIKTDKPSAYIRLPFFQHLFFVEIGMAPIKDPSQLAITYFPPRFHWIPEHPLKDISYYTTILVETKSVHFKPILDQKMIRQQLKNAKKAKYEMGNFCEQFGFTKKNRHTKRKNVKPERPAKIFRKHKRSKPVKTSKGRCFNCGKKGHYADKCPNPPNKLKNKINSLKIDEEEMNDLFRILQSQDYSDSDSSYIDEVSSDDPYYHSASESSSKDVFKIGCSKSCCESKFCNVTSHSPTNG